jgi:ornithine decarboxylase
LKSAAAIFRTADRGIALSMVNLGGGFPTKYLLRCLRWRAMAARSSGAAQALRQRHPETIIEPGRGMVGNAGIIEAEVVLVSKKSEADKVRVYLDIGKSRRPRRNHGRVDPLSDPHAARRRRGGPLRAGGADLRPMDALREAALRSADQPEIGDKVLIEGTGAYTTTYARSRSTASRR